MRGSHFALLTVKADLKGFCLMIFLEIDSDDDDFAVLLVGKSSRFKRMSIEPSSHLAHFFANSAPRNVILAVRMLASMSRFAAIEPSEMPRIPTNSDYELV
jgi:hypothetical protein